MNTPTLGEILSSKTKRFTTVSHFLIYMLNSKLPLSKSPRSSKKPAAL